MLRLYFCVYICTASLRSVMHGLIKRRVKTPQKAAAAPRRRGAHANIRRLLPPAAGNFCLSCQSANKQRAGRKCVWLIRPKLFIDGCTDALSPQTLLSTTVQKHVCWTPAFSSDSLWFHCWSVYLQRNKRQETHQNDDLWVLHQGVSQHTHTQNVTFTQGQMGPRTSTLASKLQIWTWSNQISELVPWVQFSIIWWSLADRSWGPFK